MASQTVYHVTIYNRTIRVQLRSTGDATFARIDDGPERQVGLTSLRGPLRALTTDHSITEVMASRLPDETIGVVLHGLDYRAEVVDEARARLASVAGGADGAHARYDLKAPMPGLVVKVLCAPGDDVTAGQPLAVLQAMKMENELNAPRPGRIASVGVTEGQTVEQGQVLVTVE